MSLTSLIFGLFCIVTICTYFVIPKKYRWVILLIASFIFLFYGNLTVATLIQALLIVLVSYFCGIQIEKSKNKKLFLFIGISLIIFILIYLKYTNLFLVTFNYILKLFKISYEFKLVHRNSLIGLSYYSLIIIGYLIDIYRGTCKCERNILKFALFVTYFPILTSGPFIKYNDMKEQLYEGHKFNYERMCQGLVRILWGLFKILVISERIGTFVNLYYGNLELYKGVFMLLAIVLFPLQLYTNFSGSIDVIMGISQIIGIELPENFHMPFFSKTLTELWRRWHITLGSWLRDYIFYPLLKSNFIQKLNIKLKNKFNKKFAKKATLYLSMFVMWLIIGIWHGGAYTFIIGSGILQFIIMVLEDLLEPVSKKITQKFGIKRDSFFFKLYQVIRTYLLFAFTMIFFRANSVSQAIHIIKNIFVFNPKDLLNLSLLVVNRSDILYYVVIFLSLSIMFIIELLKRKNDVIKKLFEQNIIIRWLLIYSLIFLILIFGCYGVGYDATEFIYGGF